MEFSELNIERQIVKDEIKNIKSAIDQLNKFESMSTLHRIEDLQVVLEEKIQYEKSLY